MRAFLKNGILTNAAIACFSFLVVTGTVYAEIEFRKVSSGEGFEIWIDGSMFTAYRFGPGFEQKPVFYPVVAPNGVSVNRELPFDNEQLRESQDHFHHQSVFMGYGDVGGLDFWSCRDGETIRHRAFLADPAQSGIINVILDWVAPDGTTVLNEFRRVKFGGGQDVYWMDHDITLTALDKNLPLNDTKEGMFAIRVADELTEEDGTGRYVNAFGWETSSKIWGKRSPWVALRGEVGGKEVTIAIFDHPSTHNHPSYWHARGYGLFAVNPFGRKDFLKGSEPWGFSLAAHESVHFRYRLLIYDGKVDKSRLDQDYWDYAD